MAVMAGLVPAIHVLLAMSRGYQVKDHTRSRSRGANAPELCKLVSAQEGRGECRALDAPAVSRAKWGREHTRSSPWVHRGHPAFPHAMVLTVSFVISPVIGLVCHRRLASAQSLTPASRRQDHTTSPSAFSTVRQRCHPRPLHPVQRP